MIVSAEGERLVWDKGSEKRGLLVVVETVVLT